MRKTSMWTWSTTLINEQADFSQWSFMSMMEDDSPPQLIETVVTLSHFNKSGKTFLTHFIISALAFAFSCRDYLRKHSRCLRRWRGWKRIYRSEWRWSHVELMRRLDPPLNTRRKNRIPLRRILLCSCTEEKTYFCILNKLKVQNIVLSSPSTTSGRKNEKCFLLNRKRLFLFWWKRKKVFFSDITMNIFLHMFRFA